MRNSKILACAIITFLCLTIAGCREKSIREYSPQQIATSWAELTMDIMKNTPANSPTYASRTVAYIGLTMYESIVNGFPSHQSLTGELNGLDNLPLPAHDQNYDWLMALNAGQAVIIKKMYNQTSDENKHLIDSLENDIQLALADVVSEDVAVQSSIDFGRAVAEAIFAWSENDGGHRGYLKNFDKSLVHPVRPGSWKPPLYAQSISHHPLHPFWGENRTFLSENSSLPLPTIIPYDTVADSPYYQQFVQVYEQDKQLTQEDKEVAIWWGDDPADTFTPPGHSFYLATLAIKKENPEVIKCAETYARVGLAVADAFINCWKWKYHFFTERPNTFIPKFIDPVWESFWPDPPFPSFPSGHAIQAAASATVLEDLYGGYFEFVDSSHVGRERDELRDVDFKPRSFTSFWEVAEETANSRFYGGIHTPQDNEVGLSEGKKIAIHVNMLPWHSED